MMMVNLNGMRSRSRGLSRPVGLQPCEEEAALRRQAMMSGFGNRPSAEQSALWTQR